MIIMLVGMALMTPTLQVASIPVLPEPAIVI